MLMEKYICIHGHFYQPPRENPWLEAIELQDSAFPYHDWNERIAAECYAPNTLSRILDGEGRIIRLPNNYATISCNFGPTLLAWLMDKTPEIYEAILAADRQSQERFSGHGSALAQAYNHMIMPLAHRRDKYTQVLWGIRDFEHRFGRPPEGMWLPETALDIETLDIMAELGIRFTILAPRQAHKVRKIGQGHWRDVRGGRIDPTTAYLLKLCKGRTMNLFFYDGPISQGIAFEDVLERGENLASRLVNAFSEERPWPQLVHIATDGETYGHHRTHGDMALAYALDYLETENFVRLTNYGEFLEKHPPSFEVKILENSSWSCVHGVERWWKDCGCNSGMHPGWSQAWRTPLREALDWLRDTLAPQYEAAASRFLKDPWAARNDYISVILKRDRQEVAHFLEQHASRSLDPGETSTVLKLLEMQRHAMLMYTSCGWFFDDLSGLETVQVLEYAGRVVQLARDILGEDPEPQFLQRLEQAKSNIPEHGDGRQIFEKFVKPAMVDLLTVGAHYAISSLFEDYQVQDRIFCYTIDQEDYRLAEAGKAKLAVGRIRVTSDITWNSATISFAVLHFGDHNLSGGVREFQGEEPYGAMAWEVSEAFSWADFPETLRRLDQHFGTSTYSLRSLFRDEQRQILDQIIELSLEEIRSAYGRLYTHNVPLMRFHKELGVPLPRPFLATAEIVLNRYLLEAFQAPDLDLHLIRSLLEEARLLQVELEGAGLEYALRKAIERLAERFRQNPIDLECLQQLEAAMTLETELPFAVLLWKVQNIYYELLHSVYPQQVRESEPGPGEARSWVEHFAALGAKLSVRVD
jgi:alpha-amylase/alpha-mannosidase (GH57 family)